MINKFGYVIYWKIITGIFLLLIYFHIFRLSNEVFYRQNKGIQEAEKITLEIDICYDLRLTEDTCKIPVDTSSHQKIDLGGCDFDRPISCLTKDFRKKTPSEIIGTFKKCNLESLVKVESETNLTVGEDEHKLELFSGYICVQYKFNVNSDREVSKIKIYPSQKNKQNFHILIHTERKCKKSSLYSLKSHLLERYCWVENKNMPGNETSKAHNCSEESKEILFELFYFSQKNLEYPMDSNCVYRKNENQYQCYEKCMKRKGNFYHLTYDENDKEILNYDKNASYEQSKKCANQCKQSDCIEGTFQIPTLVEQNLTSENYILLKVNNSDVPSVAQASFKSLDIFYLVLMYFCLFFGVDLYWLIVKATNMYNNPVKKNTKYKFINKKVIGLSAVTVSGILIGIFLEKQMFNFGRNDDVVLTKLDSIKERNISVSICYDLCEILKSKTNLLQNETCDRENLLKFDLKQLNLSTWNQADFKKVSSMRNSVRIFPIRQEDYEIKEFFREFKKCFLLYYPGKNLYPPISLQRKSQIHLNSSSKNFDYFYIEDGSSYPQVDAVKNKTSFLHNIYITDLEGRDCMNFKERYKTCESKDDCIQMCILERYALEHKAIPIYVNMKLTEAASKNYSNLKFEDDKERFQKKLDECKDKYKRDECYSIKTTLRTKYVISDPHNISITLTPKIFYKHRTKDEHFLIVINRIISFIIILTGFSVKDTVKGFVSTYLFSLASIYNFQFINRIAYLIVVLFFSMHFTYLFYSLVNDSMLETSHLYVLKEVQLPKVRLCYELDKDLNSNQFAKKHLEADSLNISDVLQSITLLDENQEKRTMEVDEVESKNNTLIVAYDFYVDNLKCFNFVFKIKYQILTTNILEANKLVTFVLKLNNITRKRMFVHLNGNSLDLEWYYPLKANFYYNIIYMIENYRFQDDFWMIKNFYCYLKDFFNIEKLRNTHERYYMYLRDSFTREQYVTTTVVPLGKDGDRDATIKNQQFNSYIHFRSLAGNKNDYDFDVNNERKTFMSDFTSEKSYLGNNHLVISLRSVLVKNKIHSLNRYRMVEFYMHLFILTAFWFKIDFSTLPISLKKAFPIAKFFVICFLYCIVVFLLFLFETWFKLIRFLDFKYA